MRERACERGSVGEQERERVRERVGETEMGDMGFSAGALYSIKRDFFSLTRSHFLTACRYSETW